MWENSKNKTTQQVLNSIKKDCCENPDCTFDVKHNRYKDVVTTARYIYQHEGAIGFTKGVFPRLSINVPATALSWGTYELVKSFLIRKD
jgi:hypothetical protein